MRVNLLSRACPRARPECCKQNSDQMIRLDLPPPAGAPGATVVIKENRGLGSQHK